MDRRHREVCIKMAIRIVDQYPGKTAGENSDYPQGQARNVSAPGDGTGTPWEAAIVNDDQGFKQALLEAAGITPSGNPDTARQSQYLEALLELFMRSDVISGVSTSSNGTLNIKISATRTLVFKWGSITTSGNNVVGSPQNYPISGLSTAISFAVLSPDGAATSGLETAHVDWQRTAKDNLALYANYVGICRYFLIGY